jgi:hypothetical protein
MPAIALLVCQENFVNLLPISKPCAALAWVVAALAGGLSGTAVAQATAPSPSPVLTAEPATTGFRSALDGYQPYTDEKILSWKDANDTTARIGGWRAYAKEAQQSATPGAASQPDPHAGHGKPSQDKKP